MRVIVRDEDVPLAIEMLEDLFPEKEVERFKLYLQKCDDIEFNKMYQSISVLWDLWCNNQILDLLMEEVEEAGIAAFKKKYILD